MFAVLARPIARRSFGYTARCMATKKNAPRPPPPPPPPASNDAEEKPVFSSTVNLDILPEEPQPRPSQRTGARSSLDSLSSAERRRRRIGGFTTVLFVGFLGFQLAYMTRDWDESELQLKKWVRVCLSCNQLLLTTSLRRWRPRRPPDGAEWLCGSRISWG